MAEPQVSETRWLDDDEQLAWRSLVDAYHLLFDRLDRELREETGLTLEDYEVLVVLSESPDQRLRMSELAERLLRSRSRLTYRIDHMEQAGLVRRERCPEDRRGLFAHLTDGGMAALESAAPIHVEGVRRHLFDVMDGDALTAAGPGLADVVEHLRRSRSG